MIETATDPYNFMKDGGVGGSSFSDIGLSDVGLSDAGLNDADLTDVGLNTSSRGTRRASGVTSDLTTLSRGTSSGSAAGGGLSTSSRGTRSKFSSRHTVGGLSKSTHGFTTDDLNSSNRGTKFKSHGGLNHNSGHGRVGHVTTTTTTTTTAANGADDDDDGLPAPGGARMSLQVKDLSSTCVSRPSAISHNNRPSTTGSLSSAKRSHGFSSRLRQSFLNGGSSLLGGFGRDSFLGTSRPSTAGGPGAGNLLGGGLLGGGLGGSLLEEEDLLESDDGPRTSGGPKRYDSRMLQSDDQLMSIGEMKDVSTYSEGTWGDESSRRRYSTGNVDFDETTVSGFLNARVATFWNNIHTLDTMINGEEEEEEGKEEELDDDDDDLLYRGSTHSTKSHQPRRGRHFSQLEGIRDVLSSRSLHGSFSYLQGNPQDNSFSSGTGKRRSDRTSIHIFNKNMEALTSRMCESTANEEDKEFKGVDQQQVRQELSITCSVVDLMGGTTTTFTSFCTARLATFAQNIDFVQDWTKDVANDIGSSQHVKDIGKFQTFSKNVDYAQSQVESLSNRLGDKMEDAHDSFSYSLHESHPNVFLNV